MMAPAPRISRWDDGRTEIQKTELVVNQQGDQTEQKESHQVKCERFSATLHGNKRLKGKPIFIRPDSGIAWGRK